MRSLTSAFCTIISGVFLVSCSNNSAGPSSSSVPSVGNQSSPSWHHRSGRTPINSAGWKLASDIHRHDARLATGAQRGGYYASEYQSDGIGVYGYSPKPNNDNSPPVCSASGSRYNVNGIATDAKGTLIVPASSVANPSGDTSWNVSVFQGSTEPLICGQLLGTIPTNTGQPVDAASFNAEIKPIVVSQIDFTTSVGEIVLCSLSSLGCGAPVTSTAITGYSAGVATDAAGDCWLSTATGMSDDVPTGFQLIYWAGCTGNGVVATGTDNQSSYGGLFIDNAGNLGSFDAFNSKLFVYSGCTPNCTQIGEFALKGQSMYGNLNGSGKQLAVGDMSNGSVDVYSYALPNLKFLYSFNSGLETSLLVESGIFTPSNQRLRR